MNICFPDTYYLGGVRSLGSNFLIINSPVDTGEVWYYRAKIILVNVSPEHRDVIAIVAVEVP